MNLRDAISEASTSISRRDAETLLLHLLHRDRAYLLAHPEDPLDPATHAQLLTLTGRRAAHEPLQYLTGHQEFFGLDLRVTPATLIPRPETELLVESVLAWARALPPQPLRIIDVGTGTGAIAIALATHLPQAHLFALDISTSALAIAHENALTHNVAHRISFLHSDLLSALPHQTVPFDAIVSNPPYVPLTDASSLAPEVRDHEPHSALFAGPSGLDIYRRLIPQTLRTPPHAALRPGGLLALEFGFGQHESLRTLLTTQPPTFTAIQILNDYAAIPRVALATRI
jgi:release factor glutamine methyltransferase